MTGGKEKENSEELGNQLFGGINDLFIKITITQRQFNNQSDSFIMAVPWLFSFLI